jgi:hypothetical protein
MVHLFCPKNDINSNGIHSCVRKVLNSLEVVIMNYDEEEGMLEFVRSNKPITPLTYKEVMRHTVVLPTKLVCGDYINQVIAELEDQASKVEEKLGLSLPQIFTPYLILVNNQFTLKRINNNGREKYFNLSYDNNLGLVID